MSVAALPVVLAPLALRAPGTLNAGRGAKARRARRRVRRLLWLVVGCSSANTRTWLACGSGLWWVRVVRTLRVYRGGLAVLAG